MPTMARVSDLCDPAVALEYGNDHDDQRLVQEC